MYIAKEQDPLLPDVAEFIREGGKPAILTIQTQFNIGYVRAARLLPKAMELAHMRNITEDRVATFDAYLATLNPDEQRAMNAWLESLCVLFRRRSGKIFGQTMAKELIMSLLEFTSQRGQGVKQ